MSAQHRRFVCGHCGRAISGCLPSCEGEHVVEKVDSCAFCAKLPASERAEVVEESEKPVRKTRKVEVEVDPVSATDEAEQAGLMKLATKKDGALW